MKREIKFRMWDDDLKVLYTPQMDEEEKNLWNVPILQGGVLKHTDNRIFEQYTGLKDKNGVEIYDGDILKTEGIVTWNDVEHRWSVIDLEWNDKREWHCLDYTTVPLEVIGNIHENPELL